MTDRVVGEEAPPCIRHTSPVTEFETRANATRDNSSLVIEIDLGETDCCTDRARSGIVAHFRRSGISASVFLAHASAHAKLPLDCPRIYPGSAARMASLGVWLTRNCEAYRL